MATESVVESVAQSAAEQVAAPGTCTRSELTELVGASRRSPLGPGGGSVARARTVPTDLLSAHVELGYASTLHRAQGLTVDHARILATPTMTGEALYVAMTRGRHTNHAYIPPTRPIPAARTCLTPGSTHPPESTF